MECGEDIVDEQKKQQQYYIPCYYKLYKKAIYLKLKIVSNLYVYNYIIVRLLLCYISVFKFKYFLKVFYATLIKCRYISHCQYNKATSQKI